MKLDNVFTYINDISFANPELLWLLCIIPLMLVWYIWKSGTLSADMQVSSFDNFEGTPTSARQYLRHILPALRFLAIALLIIVLARPQSHSSSKTSKTEGIDIIISFDISTSMLAQDFKPNRLEASKDVAIDFIDGRPNDRIGLVIFSGESFTQCPLTTDHAVIKNLFAGLKPGIITDGTALGMGLANAVNRIKDSNAKSKVVILLTDGVNNAGSISPLTAADIAKLYGIRVYTIGIGTIGKALFPVGMYPNGQYAYDYQEVKIDEEVMTKIAEVTGGKYFRATDKSKLKGIYQEIDKMEKTIVEEKNYTNKEERFLPFAIAAGILFLLELLLKQTIFRTIP